MVGPAPPQIGGMESFVGDLMRTEAFQSAKIELLNISKPKLAQKPRKQIHSGYGNSFKRGASLIVLSFGYSLRFSWRYLSKFITHRFQLVHIHTASYTSFWEKCFYISLAKTFRKMVVLHIHGALFDRFYLDSAPLLQKLLRFFLNRCDHVIVLSERWHEFFCTLIPKERLTIVTNGIDLAPFQGIRIEKSGIPRVLFLGEVGQRKGIYDLLRAAARLVASGTVCHFDIVGPGEIERAKTVAQDLGIDTAVTFWGPKIGAEKVARFANASLLTLPSYAEGLPIVILEALAAGLPVVATRVGGIPEVVSEGENGFLIEPGDVERLTERIGALLNYPDMRMAMARKNRVMAQQQYDINRCAQQIIEVYQIVTGVSEQSC